MHREGGDFMKVIEKKPRRPRARGDEKRQATKEAIRDVYADPETGKEVLP